MPDPSPNASFQTLADWYRHGPFQPFLESHRIAGSTPLHMILANEPAGDWSDPAFPELTIGIHRRGPNVFCRFDAGAGRFQGRSHAGSLYLIPPNAGNRLHVDGPHQTLGLNLPASTVLSAMEEHPTAPHLDFGRLHSGPFHDPLIRLLIERLWDAAADPSKSSSLFVDSATSTLAAALLAASGRISSPRPPATLAPAVLRRVLRFIQDNLGADLSLRELAAVARLSPFHFARRFKASTGKTPHQFVLEQRVLRARQLISERRLSLSEIAFALGFSSQSHLGAVFRRLTGVAPSAYRSL